MCTVAEVLGGEGAGSGGCGHDARMVWASGASSRDSGVHCGGPDAMTVSGRIYLPQVGII